jgi:hypothetical protein
MVSFAKVVEKAVKVGQGLLFCRKVMSLTEVGEPSWGNRSRKDKDKKKRKAEESASDEEKQ